MCQLNPILLISFQEELNLQHCQHPHYGGREHWLSQEPSSWPTTEINTPTDNLEIGNVHIAYLQPSEDITQRFSKLNRLIRVIGYYKRFISNCRNPKTNRKSTILSTQDLDQALICYEKIVKQFYYAQEMRI